MVKRLTIDDKIFNYMLSRLKKKWRNCRPVASHPGGHTNPAGLQVYKKSVPLGVIGIIYESRSKVTTDAAGVCIKSGNAVILRGGSEAQQTNTLLTDGERALCFFMIGVQSWHRRGKGARKWLPGCVNRLTGESRESGPAWIDHPFLHRYPCQSNFPCR